MEKNTVTLEDMLESKESRAAYQKFLINKYKCPLVSFTVVMPGPVKQSEMSEKIFRIGKAKIEDILEKFDVVFKDERIKKTGYEAYYAVDLSVSVLKNLMTEIEDGSRIGRLFDIDVIDTDLQPISRADIGMDDRKCLICGKPAHACSRSRKHSVEELLNEIERVLKDE